MGALNQGEGAMLRPVASNVRLVYAAALYANRQEAQSREAIEALLREDPTFRIATAQYEPGFVQLFDRVSRALGPDLEQIAAEQARVALEAQRRVTERRALAMRLLSEDTRVERTPRALMFLPFGVGQFANRQPELGFVFLSIETLALGVASVTGLVYGAQYQPGQFVDASTQSSLRTLYAVNLVSVGVLASVFLGGVVQANVAYRAERTSTVPRALPRGLDGLQLSAMPAVMQMPDGTQRPGLSLVGRF